MPQSLSISTCSRELVGNGWDLEFGHPITTTHRDCLVTILNEMRNGRRRDCYSAYAPWMNMDSNPTNRRIIGEVLYFLWCKCQDDMLPELNFLVVNKRSGYPGKAMLDNWVKLYGDTQGFKRYCDTRAFESTKFLDSGLVVIVP